MQRRICKRKYTISSIFSNKILSPQLQFAWAWDTITLPSTSLDNPQHLDHMVNEIRNKIHNIQDSITSPDIFKSMLSKSTFSFKKTAIIMWLDNLPSTLFNSICYHQTPQKHKHFGKTQNHDYLINRNHSYSDFGHSKSKPSSRTRQCFVLIKHHTTTCTPPRTTTPFKLDLTLKKVNGMKFT
jgi:hypothetical protein